MMVINKRRVSRTCALLVGCNVILPETGPAPVNLSPEQDGIYLSIVTFSIRTGAIGLGKSEEEFFYLQPGNSNSKARYLNTNIDTSTSLASQKSSVIDAVVNFIDTISVNPDYESDNNSYN